MVVVQENLYSTTPHNFLDRVTIYNTCAQSGITLPPPHSFLVAWLQSTSKCGLTGAGK